MLLVSGSDLGRRVVVRRLLPDASATDVLGELVHLDDRVVAVLPDDGPLVEVPLADVVAAKPVPPRAVRPGSGPDAVQRVADHGWPGLERQRLGGWVLRVGGGFTGRANSALAVGDPGLPLEEAVAAVEAFYDARDLPPKVQVPFGLYGPVDPAEGVEVDAWLAGGGWTHDETTLLLTADLRSRPPLLGAGRGAARPAGGVRIDEEPDEEWLSQYRYRGGALPPVAREVLLAAPWQRFASVRAGGRTVAVGRVAVARGWAGVTAMTVDEAYRRQGLGSVVLESLLSTGAAAGARFAYLQVVATSTAAVSLYRRGGFTPHHRYHYRTRGK